ncbi:hypothetical protein L1987_61334 [Smallanthus sonchifolius]|uniref:Uncharacterized protein n=1 Tax=Smallanthus sonchifolius TaxID=185202 RepID=A0ACB9DAK6_9ASTR|nr:hypothetical protein L1987_61334 [Smallanthus sonchifolius]
MDSKLHPAITVSNIKNLIPITLEMETGQYTSWSELFKIHCRAYQVYDHLHPKPVPQASSSAEKDKDKVVTSVDLWDRVDAIVLQWIYGTISNDLLHTILKPGTTAYDTWTPPLANLFQDNKTSRDIYLEHKFSNTRLDNFTNISAYCQALKVLADQLANVDSPVSNQLLVLQMISRLNEWYEGIAMLLQQTSPLPDFHDARSKLILEEPRKANQAMNAAQAASTVLHTTAHKSDNNPHLSSRPEYRQQDHSIDRNQGRGCGRGSGGRGHFFSPSAPNSD